MARNRRIIFATQQVAIKGDGATTYRVIHGAQSFNKTTTFNLEQVFVLGQLAIYENIEGVPNVEATMSKVLDGYPLIWHEASVDSPEPTLIARANTKCLIALSIYPDTNSSATGVGGSEAEISGAFVTSLSYNFPVDGNFTENVTFQASDIVWANDPRMTQGSPWPGANTLNVTGGFPGNDDAPIGSGGVNRRENFIWDYSSAFGVDDNGQIADPDASTVPPEVDGISPSGTNEKTGDAYNSSIQSIVVNCNLAREDIFQLGRRTQYFRTLQFPTEVTCEITVIGGSGDMVSTTERGIYTASDAGQCSEGGNLADRTIRLATCEGTRIYLGKKNKLSSVSYSGGDAGGGNVTITYSYSTFNDLTVVHSGDPNPNGATWWTNRADWLTD
jgi:hypothetical protein